MFGFGSLSHILVVLVLALILIGPKQLPEVARTIGRLLSELRRASNMFQDQINAQMRDLDHQNIIRPQEEQQSNSLSHVEHQPVPHTEEQLELQPQPTEEASANTSSATLAETANPSDEKKS